MASAPKQQDKPIPALQDKIVMVTGASQGLGGQVAKVYADVGATVILVARHQEKLERVYDAIAMSGGPEPFAICFDLMSAEESEFAQFAAAVDEATGDRPDGIMHCASYFYSLSPLDFQTVAEWVDQYRVNTVIPMGLTRTFAPILKTLPDASIILVSEGHSETPQAYRGGFGTSKAALSYLCKVAADEQERFPNLHADVLIPDPINSSQRIKSRPGELHTERKNYHDTLPQFVWWTNEEGKGRTGEIVYLWPVRRSRPYRQRNQV